MDLIKIWTVQKREVVDYALANDIFYPSFNKSDYAREVPGLDKLYDLLLASYNEINDIDVEGLIFGFMMEHNNNIFMIRSYEQFVSFIRSKSPCLLSLWKRLSNLDCVVVELTLSSDLNYIPIDLNDFQYIIPPVWIMPPYSENDFARICENIMNGICEKSPLPSGVIQVHLPCLDKRTITGIYPMFDLEETFDEPPFD